MQTDTGFFDAAQGGDPNAFEHFYWLMGHPETWLMLLVWAFILFAVIRVALKLFRARRIYVMFFFLAVVFGLAYFYVQLFKGGIDLFAAGEGRQAYQIRIANWIVLFMGFASAVWLIFERVTKPKPKQ